MPTWLLVLCNVGGVVAYAIVGGVAYAIAQRVEALSDDPVSIAIFWPVFAAVGAIGGLAWTFGRFGQWAGGAIVDGVLAWHRRSRMPRKTARRKGGR